MLADFVFARAAGAGLPIGGGELARDNEADVTEALSDVSSFAGVPGRLMEATLGCLEACRTAWGAITGTAEMEEAEIGGGVSVLGV